MAGQGGKREGAGRPSNAVKYEPEIRVLNDAIAAKVQEIFDKGMELVRGVEVQKLVRGREITYIEPPSAKMIIFFLEKLAGKPAQAIELNNGDDGPLKIRVVYEDALDRAEAAEAPQGPAEDPPGDGAV